MRRGWICVLACALITASTCVAAQSVATLPPYVSPSVQAPTADLEIRMLLPDPRIDAIVQVVYEKETIGLVSRAKDGTDTLWLYDVVQGTFALRYEAPLGYQIVSPVYCTGEYYWAQWQNGSTQGWEIMTLRSETDRIERVRADTYTTSTMAPTLQTDGDTVYWYETDQPEQETARQIPVQLYCLDDEGIPKPLLSLQMANDEGGPMISEGVLTTSRYDTQSGKWTLILFSINTGEALVEYDVGGQPMGIQTQGDRILWIEGETSEIEMGRIAVLEEDNQLYIQDEVWPLNGRLMLLHSDDEMAQVIDSGVEQALLLPFGIVYVNTSGMLYCYSFLLDQPIRLSASGDYQPVMDGNAEELLVIRRIWTGDEGIYRPEVFNLKPLSKGWPNLQ